MDLREKKTKRSIVNAFLELRCKKPLERITVTELAQLAEISKATFYLHYRDIFDLSEQLQEEVIQNVLAGLTHPEACLADAQLFTRELFFAFYAQQSLLEILFSGAQSAALPQRVEQELCGFIKKHGPQLDVQDEMRLTYTVHGGYAVYQKYCLTHSVEEVIHFVGEASRAISNKSKI